MSARPRIPQSAIPSRKVLVQGITGGDGKDGSDNRAHVAKSLVVHKPHSLERPQRLEGLPVELGDRRLSHITQTVTDDAWFDKSTARVTEMARSDACESGERWLRSAALGHWGDGGTEWAAVNPAVGRNFVLRRVSYVLQLDAV